LKSFVRNALAVLALTFPVVALADVTGTPTLSAGSNLNLDTGATATSGGDISWNGTSITVVGSAKDVDLASTPVASLYNGPSGFTQVVALGQESASLYASAFGSFLVTSSITPQVNDILVVKTNGGNYAAVLVTAKSGTISLQFDTLVSGGGGGGTPSGPQITGVTNNYSYIPTGFPNSGIAPGTIFLIFGSGMSQAPAGNVTLQSSASPGIPTQLAGATLSVSAGGKTFTPGMYYATPGQIAAVLPSGTPTGTATITVTYNNATSNAFQFQVVPSALGLNTYYGTGSGLVVAVNAVTGTIYNYTNSAKPGDTIILFGSGLGADTADSDTVYTSSPHPVSTPTVYFGGVAVKALYGGSSGYPGYDQINVTIPANAPTDCFVALAVVSGSGSSATVSNFTTLPISASGGDCNSSFLGLTGTTITSVGGGTSTVRSGSVFIGQLVGPAIPPATGTTTTNIADADFSKTTSSSFGSSNGSFYSIGSCFVSEVVSSSGGGTSTSTGLDAGSSIGLTGPAGSYTLAASTFAKGIYEAQLPASAITSTGGAFTFTGTGGADVGSFTATVNLPNPILTWTNQSAAATITRTQGVTVNWTGGAPGSYVIISGSSLDLSSSASGSFVCLAPQSALTFTVPSYVTLTLPAGTGSLDVENGTSFGTFKASQLDYGTTFGFTGVDISSTYQ